VGFTLVENKQGVFLNSGSTAVLFLPVSYRLPFIHFIFALAKITFNTASAAIPTPSEAGKFYKFAGIAITRL
jgi:hypothetical protein